MKIHFCDLCNESVPESDLAAGRAQRRKGRVICAACERSMKGAGGKDAAPSPVTDSTNPVTEPARQETVPRAPRGRGAVGVLTLIFVLVLAVYKRRELDDLSQQHASLRSTVERDTSSLGRDLDESTRRGRDRLAELQSSMELSMTAQREESAALVAALRADLSREVERVDDLQSELERVRGELGAADRAGAQRVDELMAQAMKARERVDALDERLRESELAIARGALSAPASGPQAEADSQYLSELADLASDSAGVRWNAVQALGETGDPAVIAHLVPLLEDPDVFVRMAVARVLGDLAAPEAIEPLIDALGDDEAVVREAAMVALHGITGRNFRFDPVASPAERSKKIKAWRDWWEGAREQYFGES